MASIPISTTSSTAHPRDPQPVPPYSEVPLTGSASLPAPARVTSPDITHFVAAGTLLAGGILMITGRRRTGMAVAAAGTAFAMLQEQDTVKQWWNSVPGFLTDAQKFIDKLEGFLHEASAQGQRLQQIIRR